MGKLSNVFALRFRGVDPERFLNWLYQYTGWFFRWPTVVLRAAAWRCPPLSLVVVQFEEFQRKLPAFHQFFGPKNWFYLGITMAHGQSAARVRPRPVVQALRRRMSRAGRDDARVHACAVLQRFRFLDAAQQVASGRDRRGGHVRRVVPRLDRHVRLVV